MPNMIMKRVRLREACLPSNDRLIIASTDGWVDHRAADNSDCVGLSGEAICDYLPCLLV